MPARHAVQLVACFVLGLPLAAAGRDEKTFLVRNASRNVDEFRAFAKTASREGGSPWHEYAATHANLAKFFPHPKIAPHLPADWVAGNRALR